MPGKLRFHLSPTLAAGAASGAVGAVHPAGSHLPAAHDATGNQTGRCSGAGGAAGLAGKVAAFCRDRAPSSDCLRRARACMECTASAAGAASSAASSEAAAGVAPAGAAAHACAAATAAPTSEVAAAPLLVSSVAVWMAFSRVSTCKGDGCSGQAVGGRPRAASIRSTLPRSWPSKSAGGAAVAPLGFCLRWARARTECTASAGAGACSSASSGMASCANERADSRDDIAPTPASDLHCPDPGIRIQLYNDVIRI